VKRWRPDGDDVVMEGQRRRLGGAVIQRISTSTGCTGHSDRDVPADNLLIGLVHHLPVRLRHVRNLAKAIR
jgi:hypothetical protein